MKKSIYTPRAEFLVARLKLLRKKSGLTQRQMATQLEVPHNIVGRIELGERRVDVAELHTILEVLGVDPEEEFRFLANEFSKMV